jgi:Transglutaminase-like superfamily
LGFGPAFLASEESKMKSYFFTVTGAVVLFGAMSVSSSSPAGEGGAVPQAIDIPRVLPDGCVDTSSMEGILKGLIKPGMTDHQKVLSIYQWFRRVVFHFRNMGGDRRDVLRVVNSYGCNLCGSQAGVLLVVLKAAKIKARPAFVNAGAGYGGHTVMEVFYDGKWHGFDTMTNFLVLNRGDKPSIASLDDIKKDPTLVTRAEEEKRTVGGFLSCRHKPALHYGNLNVVKKMGWKKDLRWATLAFGHGDKPGDLMTFWSTAPKKWTAGKPGSTYGGRYVPGLLDLKLKPNERWVMLWDNLGKYAQYPAFPGKGPFHTCGHTDEKDSVNFKYFEPYARKGLAPTKVCYRYFGNGFLEWSPQSPAEVAAGSSKLGGGGLSVPLKAPGAIVEIELDLEVEQTGADAKASVLLKAGRAKTKEVWTRNGELKGLQKIVIPYQPQRTAFVQCQLQIKSSGKVSVKRVKTIYQLNMYALGSLKPGKNTVRVSARTAKPRGSKLVVEYKWNDGENWKDQRSVRKEFTELPASFEVEVKGKKMPRMKSLELRVEKH